MTNREQHMAEHLQEMWNALPEKLPEQFKQITDFVLDLQDPYKTETIKIIADSIVESMRLHILGLLATFQQNSKQEKISPKNCRETLEHVLPETFPILEEIRQTISVQSIDDLVILGNITSGLEIVSRTNLAEEAQTWLYELPKMYRQELEQSHLIALDGMRWTKKTANPDVQLPIRYTQTNNTGTPAVKYNGKKKEPINKILVNHMNAA